jgi:hypothetical protein
MAETDLHRAVGRVEGKLDSVIDMLTAGNARHDARHDGFDKRVAAVEKRQAWYSGAAAAVGAIVAYLVKY